MAHQYALLGALLSSCGTLKFATSEPTFVISRARRKLGAQTFQNLATYEAKASD